MKLEKQLFERPRLVSMITVAVVVTAALAYALIPTTHSVDPAAETLTADNIIARLSIQLNSATASTLTSFDGSKKLVSFTGSSSTPCGAGSAVIGVSIAANGNVSVTCGAGGVTASSLSSAEFGLGGDGPITFDGSTTVTIGGVAMAPSGSAYTLGTDIEATNLTVNNGVTVKMAGYRIFGTGTCTNNGTASDNGNNGANGTNVTHGAGGASRAAGYLPGTPAGIQGGINSTAAADNGFFSRGVGGVAIASCNVGGTGECGGLGGAAFVLGTGGNGSNGREPCQGGAAGGGGGANIGAAGGQDSSGGAITLTAANRGDADVWQIDHGFFVYPTNIITATMPYGTGGGGGAAGGGATQDGGGGGGAPGGTVDWHCRIMAGSGVFAATGGNGGSGACDGTAGHGCSAGGGGGGGGAILLVYSTNIGTWTTNVLGGTRGNGSANAGQGTGGSGGNGSSCLYLPVNLSGDGT